MWKNTFIEIAEKAASDFIANKLNELEHSSEEINNLSKTISVQENLISNYKSQLIEYE